MKRLAPDQLPVLNAPVLTPEYAREAVGCGIVHLGIGAFHRAHQAWYTERAMNLAGGDWRITGVSMRSDTVARQLQPQAGLYSLLASDGAQTQLQVIGAVQRVLIVGEQRDAVVEAIAAATTHIVSLTITEKGYCSDVTGATDWNHTGLAADLANPNQPTTAIGVLALGLVHRAQGAGQPITILSCDNLVENGTVLEHRVRDFVSRAWPQWLPWLDTNVSFPNSMVDRIVPAMTPQQGESQSQLLGAIDCGAVATEPFSQWVIEDRFVSPRPAWERVGVDFVSDIRPYEAMKLGLLNAAHSAIASIGMLFKIDTVDQVMANPITGPFIQCLMRDELLPGIAAPDGYDLHGYCEQLLQRFANPRLQHRCAQIFTDSSVKIPQRWLPHLQHAGEHPRLLLALACWCHLVLVSNCELNDPAATRMQTLRTHTPPDALDQLLSLAGICPQSVDNYDVITEQLRAALATILSQGPSACLTPFERKTP